ncbi:unnamed protein product, partial [Closterium sp. Naga37s-1]
SAFHIPSINTSHRSSPRHQPSRPSLQIQHTHIPLLLLLLLPLFSPLGLLLPPPSASPHSLPPPRSSPPNVVGRWGSIPRTGSQVAARHGTTLPGSPTASSHSATPARQTHPSPLRAKTHS